MNEPSKKETDSEKKGSSPEEIMGKLAYMKLTSPAHALVHTFLPEELQEQLRKEFTAEQADKFRTYGQADFSYGLWEGIKSELFIDIDLCLKSPLDVVERIAKHAAAARKDGRLFSEISSDEVDSYTDKAALDADLSRLWGSYPRRKTW